jgi:S-adenosyl-L-methionine hydrolase (adenosine-forming)
LLPITFLSDYGHRDEYVGVCHGVIERIAPGARVIDLVHEVPAHDVRAGSLALRRALPYLPKGVNLAVVDPGVGTARRPLAVRSHDGQQFVGPDNGLMWPAIEDCGGIDVAIDIADTPYRLDPVSATFHGRDLFAPVTARLALETPIENVGRPVSPDGIVRLELPPAEVRAGTIRAAVLAVDRFGNLILNVGRAQLQEARLSRKGGILSVTAGPARRRAALESTFGDVPVGEIVVYEDSSGAIALALNGGSAAEALSAAAGDAVELAPWQD